MSIELPKKTPRDLNISLQLSTKYHPNGQKKSEVSYEGNKKQGAETTWHSNG